MVDLETHAYNALQALLTERELSYNKWRTKTDTNIETMNKVRELLFEENLINEKPHGKQEKIYSINHALTEPLEDVLKHISKPYSQIIKSIIKDTKNIEQKLKSHQRVLGSSENDAKIANDAWKEKKENIDFIIQTIEEERLINFLICHPTLKSPYKKKLKNIQEQFYKSLQEYFNALSKLEPILFSELWKIIFFKLNPKPKL